MSSSALNQIIASSFGVDRQPGKTFLAARDNARIMDSNMAAADVARRINENNLRMQQRTAADQAALGPALLDILNAPQEQYGISRQQAEYDAARANMLENWQGQQPTGGIDPSLSDAQGKPVGAALDYLNAPQAPIQGEQAALNERQQKAYELLAGNPAYQQQMIESMFATPTSFRPATKEEIDAFGLDSSKPYQVGSDGKISAIGGGGPVVNIGEKLNPLETQLMTSFGTTHDQYRKDAQDADVMLDTIQNFRNLNNRLDTGMMAEPVLAINQFLNAVGLQQFTDMDISAAEALQKASLDFTMMQVQKTKGAVSNKEMSLFEKGAPNIAKTPKGNALILNYLERVALRKKELFKVRNEFISRLLDAPLQDQRRASLLMDAYIEEWKESNPFFTDEETRQLEGFAHIGTDMGASVEIEGATATYPNGLRVVSRMNPRGDMRWYSIEVQANPQDWLKQAGE